MVEYLLEAKKFIQRAREAYSEDARNQHLDMAEWCITRVIAEGGLSPQPGPAKTAEAAKPN